MAATVLRTLALNFVARTSNATKGIARIEKSIGGLVAFTRSAAARVAGLAAAVGVGLSVAGTVALVKSQMSAVDALAKTSDQLGIATEDLAAFQMQAELSGVGADKFAASITKMVRSIGDAIVSSNSEAGRALESLGLDPKALRAKSSTAAFLEIADAIGKVSTAQKRLDVATRIFGRGGAAMVSMLLEGREGFEANARDAKAFGLAISRIDAGKIEQANDAVNRAKFAFDGLVRLAAVQLAPIIEGLANMFVDWARKGSNAANIVADAFETVAHVIGNVGNVIQKMSELMQRFAVVSKVVQNTVGPLFSLDFTQEAEQKRQAELSMLSQELEKMKNAPRYYTEIQKWVAEARRLALATAKTSAGDRGRFFEESAAGLNVGSVSGLRSGPQGLLRGSAGAAAAEARFANRTSRDPQVDEQRRANELLKNIDRNINDIRRQGQNTVGID